MKNKKIKPPLTISFYASPTAFWSILIICGFMELAALKSVKSIILISVVSLVGTLPFTLGQMFSPPDFFRPGLKNIINVFYGKSENRSSERESYLRYVKSRYYRMLVLKFGFFLALLPYIVYLVGFIEFPESWKILHRNPPVPVGISFAIMDQWIMTFICLGAMIAIYLKKNWSMIIKMSNDSKGSTS